MSHEIQKADQTDGHDSLKTLILKLKMSPLKDSKEVEHIQRKLGWNLTKLKHTSLCSCSVHCPMSEEGMEEFSFSSFDRSPLSLRATRAATTLLKKKKTLDISITE